MLRVLCQVADAACATDSLQAHKQALQRLLQEVRKVFPAAKRTVVARKHKAAQVDLQRLQKRQGATKRSEICYLPFVPKPRA